MLYKLVAIAAWASRALIAYAILSPIQARPKISSSADLEHIVAYTMNKAETTALLGQGAQARLNMVSIVTSLSTARGFSAFVFHKCREACELVVGGFRGC
jgi:hypothetical protein